MQSKHTISTFWDSRVEDSNKESRVMLKVSIDGKPFSTAIKKFRCSKLDYDRCFTDKALSDVQQSIKDRLDDEKAKAKDILTRLGSTPSKDGFLKLYKSNLTLSADEKTDAYPVFEAEIAKLKADNQFGSATNVFNAMRSFKMYKSKFCLEDVSEKWILGYRKFMLDNGRSVSTIGIYLRVLRAIIKQCMKDKVVLLDKNPFEGVAVKGGSKSSKDIIYPHEMKKLWEYQPKGIIQTRAKDFFFFCYLCNGMNFKDVARLRNKDLKADRFVFIRSKTSTTTTNEIAITVYLSDETRRIIEKYRSKSNKPDAYLFEMFNIKDPAHHHKTFVRFKRNINKALSKISASLKINRAYLGIARHSFATKLKLDGTPTIHISEYMGHTSEKTTANYLKQLPSEQHKAMNKNLLKFG